MKVIKSLIIVFSLFLLVFLTACNNNQVIKSNNTDVADTQLNNDYPVILFGEGKDVTKKVKIEEGLHIFNMFYYGSSNFIVWLLDENGNKVELLANEIGSFEGSKALGLKEGDYIIDVDADSTWKVCITKNAEDKDKCIPQELSQSKTNEVKEYNFYTQDEIEQAIKYGKDSKNNISRLFDGYQQRPDGKWPPRSEYEDTLVVATPLQFLRVDSYESHRNYEELSPEKIKKTINSNLIIYDLVMYGEDYGFATKYKALIRLPDGSIIKPYGNLECGSYTGGIGILDMYKTICTIGFQNFDKLRFKKLDLVIIKSIGEDVFNVDMMNYK